jgi:hypothetical protein
VRSRHASPKLIPLLPVLVALMRWGDRWATDEVSSLHRSCGAPVHAELRCEAGHHVSGDNDLDLAITPQAAL